MASGSARCLGAIAARIEEPAAIVIAEKRRNAGGRNGGKGIQHFFDARIKSYRKRSPIESGQDFRVQEKVEGVNVVVGGLLKVKAVGADLPLRFLKDEMAAATPPV